MQSVCFELTFIRSCRTRLRVLFFTVPAKSFWWTLRLLCDQPATRFLLSLRKRNDRAELAIFFSENLFLFFFYLRNTRIFSPSRGMQGNLYICSKRYFNYRRPNCIRTPHLCPPWMVILLLEAVAGWVRTQHNATLLSPISEPWKLAVRSGCLCEVSIPDKLNTGI